MMDLKNINLNNYNITFLKDTNDGEILEIILLNKKYNIEDFKKAINDAKEKEFENIQNYGNDWDFIKQHLNNFDFIELDPSGHGCGYELGFYDFYI